MVNIFVVTNQRLVWDVCLVW